MDISTKNIIISTVFGLVGGGIITLISPYVNWILKKKETKRNNRSELLAALRNQIQDIDFDYVEFRNTQNYSRIRNYLNKEIITKIEKEATNISVVGGDNRMSGINNYRNLLLDELSRIEREWYLI